MQHIELIGALTDLLQHQHVGGDRIPDRGIEAQRARPHRRKLRARA